MLKFLSQQSDDPQQTRILRLFVGFIVSSVLLFLLFILLLLLPRVDKAFNSLQNESDQASVKVYAAQFYQYIDDRILSLKDIAQNQLLIDNLLTGNVDSAAVKDYLSGVNLLAEDPKIVLLDFQGNIVFSEVGIVQLRESSWVQSLLKGGVDYVVNLRNVAGVPEFEIAVPVFYGRSREGVLISRFNGEPNAVFSEGTELNSNSAIFYRQGNVEISSDFSQMQLPYSVTATVPEYQIELTHVVERRYVKQQKTEFTQGLLIIVFIGALLMLFLLFVLGRRIILKPYKDLVETQQAISQAVEGISRIDTRGNYIDLNASYAGTAGYIPEELQGKPWSITVHEEDLPALEQAYQEMLKTGRVTAEARGIKKDGSPFYKQVTMISQYQEDEFVGHHCFMQDITEKKQAEIEKEQLISKLAESNEWLEQFAFACSHDLQEPLRIVRIFSEKLQEIMSVDAFDKKEVQHCLRYIIESSQRAQNLIRDILAYSKIDQDSELLQTIDLDELLTVLVKNLDQSLKKQNATIQVDGLPSVSGNKTQLHQLFQNLITNGLKYQATDASPHIHVGVEDQQSYWQFFIKDNGIGIKERYVQRIFEVFKRLHTQTEYAGTGIGLAICRKVVERHGGEIWVESEQGEGSTFYFTILKAKTEELGSDVQLSVVKSAVG